MGSPTEPRRPEGGKLATWPDLVAPFHEARIAVGAVYKIVALCRSMMRQTEAIFIGRIGRSLIDQNRLRHWRGTVNDVAVARYPPQSAVQKWMSSSLRSKNPFEVA